ncbi:carboxypeptidase-like regulatory domain-containing protein [Plebeiibacterium marinum]|uniref:Carboxypeptidase-like regulatory domain-containing protein n=1 Tax=Plebeiibacterium marinum TaxID=2992111 RepID=A0AAE3MC52_9BACT|nr:carboxypeptidase-like regulatory domain-containing protein [Plebeiobacterium marinum]MCW3804452.1 carboxypeptidase-like regulatory domain-containing protein [Plebeiobacterium marinum]
MKLRVLIIVLVAIVGLSSFKGEKSEKNSAPVATTTLNGVVVDEITGETLAGVEVVLVEINQKAYTDFDGNFTFENVPVGECSICAKMISYQDEKIEGIKVESEKESPVGIGMNQVN